MKKITHYLVVGAESEIVFSTAVASWGNDAIAKSFCHEHINDCVISGVEGAAKWLVRGVEVSDSIVDPLPFIVNHCLFLLHRMNKSESYFDVMHGTESYDRITEMLFIAAGISSEFSRIQESVTFYEPSVLLKEFHTLCQQNKEAVNAN